MLDEKEFETIKKQFEEFDLRREKIIKESRDILKLSKQAIYSIQRDDVKNAALQLKDAELLKIKLEKMAMQPTDSDNVSDAFTWYKNRAKKPIPSGTTRVVIWLSQI